MQYENTRKKNGYTGGIDAGWIENEKRVANNSSKSKDKKKRW